MTLQAGTRLGPYEVLEPVGAGGMGEVYRARDTRLDRTVAIKVLPPHLSERPELRERFEREARAISSLSHPHICALHDVGRHDGVAFLVLEYLVGETLADRVKRGQLPVSQALRCAIEMADALDAAHRHGLVHRDLKPGNVMLTKAGAKLLDFGLARRVTAHEATRASAFSQLPTEANPLTAAGAILGTFQYMAPEQLEGREADARTDVFAFGAVVYEMATGQRAFTGKTAASLVASILEHDPPSMTGLQPLTPPALERVVRRCLAKDPDERWQSARDMRNELQWIAATASQAGSGSIGVVRPRRPSTVGWAALGAAMVAALVGGFVAGRRGVPSAAEPRSTRLSITLPEGQSLESKYGSSLALSPDGTRLAYVARRGGHGPGAPGGDPDGGIHLFLRSMERFGSTLMPGTEEAFGPFFSPDGAWVAFFADGKLIKVPAAGGQPQTLCRAPEARGGYWAADGTIVLAPNKNAGLFRVSANGGTPEPVTTLDTTAGESSHRWPQVLPDGETVLATVGLSGRNYDEARIVAISLKTGQKRLLVEAATYARYVPPGYLMFARGQSLLAMRFDPYRLTVSGAAVPAGDALHVSVMAGDVDYSLSESGILAYVPLDSDTWRQRELTWVDRHGASSRALDERRAFGRPRLSPDGRRLAVNIWGEGSRSDVWTADLERRTLSRFTFGAGKDPVWTSDGARIVMAVPGMAGPVNLFWQRADGSGSVETLLSSGSHKSPSSISPDGRWLCFEQERTVQDHDLLVVSLAREAKPQVLLGTPFNERAAAFSPDGRWLAYVSNESGTDEVYVQAFPGPGGKKQISTGGGNYPVWSRSGRELFYRSNGARLMSVSVAVAADTLKLGGPTDLFDVASFTPSFDVAEDGRFLMVTWPDAQVLYNQINVILNWPADVVRRESRSSPGQE